MDEHSGPARAVDPESREWLRALGAGARERAPAVERLHGLLLGVARREVRRRGGRAGIGRRELDDLAHQATADAVMAILRKTGQFRGESRFITWACAFVMFEVSAQLGRQRRRSGALVAMRSEDWDRLPDRFGLDPGRRAEWRELVGALRRAVDEALTAHQRQLFVAIVLNDVPLDALAVELGSTRNAIYKTLFDARRNLRAALADDGLLDHGTVSAP